MVILLSQTVDCDKIVNSYPAVQGSAVVISDALKIRIGKCMLKQSRSLRQDSQASLENNSILEDSDYEDFSNRRGRFYWR